MSDIIVKFKPQGHKALINAIKELEKAQKGASGATGEYSKKSKGAVRNTRLLGGSFATMRSHLLLYNFAMSLGIKQLIEFSKQAARVKDMSRAFTTLSGTGENSAIAVSKIGNAVKGTMSQMDLFKQANNAMILGVTRNTDEMAEMFQIAQTLGAALGVDTPNAVESLITGIGRQSRLMLDNIGIIVKADEAYESYAKKLKITKDELTDAQKKQAFFTAAMESARTKAAELGNQQLTARDQFNKFNATMSDFTDFIGEKSTPVVLDFFNSFGEALKRITETDYETTLRELQEMGASAENLAKINRLISLEQASDQIQKSRTIISDSFKKIINKRDIKNVEDLNVNVEKIFKTVSVGRGMGATEIDFKFNIEDLKIEDVQKEFDRLAIMGDTAASLLTGNEEEDKSRQNRITKIKELMQLYSTIINQLQEINDAENVRSNTGKKVIQTNKDVGDSGDKIVISLEQQIKLNKKLLQSALETGKGYKNAGSAAVAAAQNVVVAKIQEAVMTYMAEAMTKIPYPLSLGVPALGAAMAAALGSVLSGSSSNATNSGGGGGTYGKFEQGGYVGGNRHSQGGTIIEAERGEFVMSRNAVESIGLETLNQMNQSGGGGSINVSVTGNVLTQDFVEGELAESIKEAVRRGSDFGIG